MATVTVTKQFKEDFEIWAKEQLRTGVFSQDEMTEFKALLRIDMAPGPDQLRAGLEVINEAGVTVPAMIDSYEDRIKCWTDFFSVCANEIRAVGG